LHLLDLSTVIAGLDPQSMMSFGKGSRKIFFVAFHHGCAGQARA
jgi:hypothetical protein